MLLTIATGNHKPQSHSDCSPRRVFAIPPHLRQIPHRIPPRRRLPSWRRPSCKRQRTKSTAKALRIPRCRLLHNWSHEGPYTRLLQKARWHLLHLQGNNSMYPPILEHVLMRADYRSLSPCSKNPRKRSHDSHLYGAVKRSSSEISTNFISRPSVWG